MEPARVPCGGAELPRPRVTGCSEAVGCGEGIGRFEGVGRGEAVWRGPGERPRMAGGASRLNAVKEGPAWGGGVMAGESLRSGVIDGEPLASGVIGDMERWLGI